MSGTVRTEIRGHTGIIWFDHAARRNAITVDMWRAIPGAARTLDDDDAVRVIVMRGAGDEAFVSGADISEFETTRAGDSAPGYDKMTAAAFSALRSVRKPLIALIHGYCIGGGAAIALTADVRYAATDAVFAVPPARLGLGYHVAGIEALVRTVGFSRTAEVLFTADRIDAATALQMGLVNAVFDKGALDGAVFETAERIAANAPLTIRSAKLNLGELAKPAAERDTKAMAAGIQACYDSEDFREGVRAFLEKRKAEFKGR